MEVFKGAFLTPSLDLITGVKIDIDWYGHGKMFNPSYQKRNFKDCTFKSNPSSFKTAESRYPDGKFKSYSVST